FFQAEDGIRDFHVTGVQTCALPILLTADERRRALALPPGTNPRTAALAAQWRAELGDDDEAFVRRALALINRDFAYSLSVPPTEIGRASCRERVRISERERPVQN